MKAIIIQVVTKLVIECEDMTVTADDVVSDMDYSFESQSIGAVIADTEILDYEVLKD